MEIYTYYRINKTGASCKLGRNQSQFYVCSGYTPLWSLSYLSNRLLGNANANQRRSQILARVEAAIALRAKNCNCSIRSATRSRDIAEAIGDPGQI